MSIVNLQKDDVLYELESGSFLHVYRMDAHGVYLVNVSFFHSISWVSKKELICKIENGQMQHYKKVEYNNLVNK